MCRARPNLQSPGNDVRKREVEEETASESSSDSSSSSAVLVAGVMLVGLFVAPQVKKLLQNRRRQGPRTETSRALYKDKYDSKDEESMQEYCFSMSDVESYSDDKEEQVPLPSPRVMESKQSIHGFESIYFEAGEKVDDIFCNDTSGWKKRDTVAIEQVKNLVYQRRFGDTKSPLAKLPSLLPQASTKHSHAIGTLSLYDNELEKAKRNTKFFCSPEQDSVSVSGYSGHFPSTGSLLNFPLNVVKYLGSPRTLRQLVSCAVCTMI